MSDKLSIPLASCELSGEMITQILATLRSSGISIYKDRFFSGGEVTDYYFRASINTEPVNFDFDDTEAHDLGYDALLLISSADDELQIPYKIQVLSVVQMNIASFGRFINPTDEEKAVAIKIPDEYLVIIPDTNEYAVSLAEKYLELFFISSKCKPPKDENILVSINRSFFYDDIKIIDKDLNLKDVLKPWWM